MKWIKIGIKCNITQERRRTRLNSVPSVIYSFRIITSLFLLAVSKRSEDPLCLFYVSPNVNFIALATSFTMAYGINA